MTLTKLYFFSTVKLSVPHFEMWIEVIMEFDSRFCENSNRGFEGLITYQMGRHLMESGIFAYVYGHRLLNKHVKRERLGLEVG